MLELQVYSGDNEFAMEEAIRQILMKESAIRREVLDPMNIPSLIDLLNTGSLFDGNILYLIRQDDPLGDEANLSLLEGYLANPSPFASAIIFAKGRVAVATNEDDDGGRTPEKRTKGASKKIMDLLKNHGLVRNFGKLRYSDLHHWVKEYFVRHGYNPDNEAVNYLIEVVGTDQGMLQSEMDKVLLFEPGKGGLHLSDLKDLVTSNVQSNIFELLDNLFGNKDKMLKALESLYRLKEPEVRILAMLLREFRDTARAKKFMETKLPQGDLMKKLGYKHPFQLEKRQKLARSMSYDAIYHNLNLLYEVDVRMKSGLGNGQQLLRATLLTLR